jgi:uncharacterized protein
MELNEEKRIPAPQDAVWRAIMDPDVLKVCIPGCESVDKKSDTEFTARVVVAVGPVKAKFTGEVTLSDIDAPNGCTISGKGSGGVAGFGKGSAVVKLRTEGAETVLAYRVNASVGGKLAQIGQRLIDSTAKKLADEFFANFVKAVTGANPAAPAAAPSPALASTPAAAASAPAASVAAPSAAAPVTTVAGSGWGKVIVIAAAGFAVLWYFARR